ncbi:MAG: DUF1178 family protein [Sterolibacterium sp.]|jgi:hypothetical protein
MIVFDLGCNNHHAFEGWFASHQAFQVQIAAGQVTCPHCNSAIIEKLPAGPHIRRSLPEKAADAAVDKQADEIKLRKVMRELLRDSENVGARFSEEARKIHYSEIPARGIHGTASAAEVTSLLEDDIAVFPLPNVLRNDIH